MKKYLLNFLLLFSLNIYGQETLNNEIITIPNGCHLSGPLNWPCLPDADNKGGKIKEKHNFFRMMKAKISFHKNCEYDVTDNNDYCHDHNNHQNQLNKVLKISTKQRNEDKNSIRLGWKWDLSEGKISLALYSHINHNGDNDPGRESVNLDKFVVTDDNNNNPVPVNLMLSKWGVFARVGGNSAYIIRNIYSWENSDIRNGKEKGGEKTLIKINAFFGGKCRAPGLKTIDATDIVVDDPADLHNYFYNGGEKIWFCNSHFEFPNPFFEYKFYASDRITLPVNPGNTDDCPNQSGLTMPYFVVEPGIKVNLTAKNSIIIKPGFLAKAGSSFIAKISDYPIFRYSNHTVCGYLKKNFTKEDLPIINTSVAFFDKNETMIML